MMMTMSCLLSPLMLPLLLPHFVFVVLRLSSFVVHINFDENNFI